MKKNDFRQRRSPQMNFEQNKMFDKFWQMLFKDLSDYKNMCKYITTLFCSLIENYDLYGDSMDLSVDSLKKLSGFNEINNSIFNLFLNFINPNNPLSPGRRHSLLDSNNLNIESESTKLLRVYKICQNISLEIRKYANMFSFDSEHVQCFANCFELYTLFLLHFNKTSNDALSAIIQKVIEIIQHSQVSLFLYVCILVFTLYCIYKILKY